MCRQEKPSCHNMDMLTAEKAQFSNLSVARADLGEGEGVLGVLKHLPFKNFYYMLSIGSWHCNFNLSTDYQKQRKGLISSK